LMGSDLLKFEGFHFHLGSQITDFSCYTHALDKMDAFIIKIKKEKSGPKPKPKGAGDGQWVNIPILP
jgi:diaminopimelate decarboxylase